MRFYDEDEQPKRDCGHQVPYCTNEMCGTICHDWTQCGCYILKCNIDDSYCDNDCEKHIDNRIRERFKEVEKILYDALDNVKRAYDFFKENK